MLSIPTIKELANAGVQYGHASSRWHPRAKSYIHTTRNKLNLIDLEQTREALEQVLPLLEERAASGKTIVLVGTKKSVAPLIQEMGERLELPYVSERWLGGTLTNWSAMQQSIARMKRTEEFLGDEHAVQSMIKKERVVLQNELERMHTKFGGVRNLTRKPDCVIVVDPGFEKNCIKESSLEGIERFGILDTTSDPTSVHHVIPANDDGPKSLKLILGLIEQALTKGLERRKRALATEEA